MAALRRFAYLGVILLSVLPGGQAFGGPLDGVVSYLKMESITADGKVLDFSQQHDAERFGNPTVVTGIVGNALRFHGAYDYLRLTSLSLPNPNELTIEYWLKIENYTDYSLCGFSSPDRLYVIRLGTTQGEIAFANAGVRLNWTSGYSDFTIGQWRHYAMTIQAGQGAAIYIDGQRRYDIPVEKVAAVLSDIPYFGIGAALEYSGTNAARFVDGAIDEFAIFNRVLNAAEIQSHYVNGLNGLGYEGATAYSSTGFEAPMASGPVTVKKNRVLPLKTQLMDRDGREITGLEIGDAPPVIQVLYFGGVPGEVTDVTSSVLPAGQGTEGNQFVFTVDGKWQYNLATKNFTAPGSYTLKIVSGDATRYVIVESYTPAIFVIE